MRTVLLPLVLLLVARTFAYGICGDGVRDGAEACDGSDLGGQTCGGATGGGAPAGTLACAPDCSFDTRDCRRAIALNVIVVLGPTGRPPRGWTGSEAAQHLIDRANAVYVGAAWFVLGGYQEVATNPELSSLLEKYHDGMANWVGFAFLLVYGGSNPGTGRPVPALGVQNQVNVVVVNHIAGVAGTSTPASYLLDNPTLGAGPAVVIDGSFAMTDRFPLLAHELGHVLGLQHSTHRANDYGIYAGNADGPIAFSGDFATGNKCYDAAGVPVAVAYTSYVDRATASRSALTNVMRYKAKPYANVPPELFIGEYDPAFGDIVRCFHVRNGLAGG